MMEILLTETVALIVRLTGNSIVSWNLYSNHIVGIAKSIVKVAPRLNACFAKLDFSLIKDVANPVTLNVYNARETHSNVRFALFRTAKNAERDSIQTSNKEFAPADAETI